MACVWDKVKVVVMIHLMFKRGYTCPAYNVIWRLQALECGGEGGERRMMKPRRLTLNNLMSFDHQLLPCINDARINLDAKLNSKVEVPWTQGNKNTWVTLYVNGNM